MVPASLKAAPSIEIRRWEADMSPHPQRVIVAWKHACSMRPRAGGVDRPASIAPGANSGVVVRWMAYAIAARKVAEELFMP